MKNCPFCGGVSTIGIYTIQKLCPYGCCYDEVEDGFKIKCSDCGVYLKKRWLGDRQYYEDETRQELITQWDTRVPQP